MKRLIALVLIMSALNACSYFTTVPVENDSPHNQNWHDESGWHPDYHDSMDKPHE